MCVCVVHTEKNKSLSLLQHDTVGQRVGSRNGAERCAKDEMEDQAEQLEQVLPWKQN